MTVFASLRSYRYCTLPPSDMSEGIHRSANTYQLKE